MKILVIKLAALGDFVQATGPFAAIREHHGGDHVTLLTTRPYADFAASSGYFDEVWLDEKPSGLAVAKGLELRRRLCAGGFARVYDLQTSDRTGWYFRLFWPGPRPEWSGKAKGCSHPHANPKRDFMHTIERQAEQLNMAGIKKVPPPDLSWAQADAARFSLGKRHALLVPGGTPRRPAKRWPYRRYLEVAQSLAATGIQPVLLGSDPEKEVLEAIADKCKESVSLAGETTFQDIAVLARDAVCSLGNDTGPMHIIAVSGCPSVVLYSRDSDPTLCAQRGPDVTIISRRKLDDIEVNEVMAALKAACRD
ncbi:MAG TPA: lipopolysaccharide heptosyltransferase family protein [Rhodospirillales bacterium]|nr:lipopolysaccharide heptosyltransferase family protein [Rhodospirillales bacterium]